jgi:hypothetical protein
MTEYGLQPSYLRLDYSSSYAPHSQTIPLKEWLPTSITGLMGSFVNWNGVPIDAEDMIDGYVDVAKTLIPTTSSYDFATIFNFDSGADKFIPVAGKSLAVAGTVTPASPNKAVSLTLNLRTLGGQAFKLVFLDYVIGAREFNKDVPSDWSAAMTNTALYVSDIDNAFSGRDNTRPSAPISATFDLNDALRKQYHMI